MAIFSKIMNLNFRTKLIMVILFTTIIPLTLFGFYIFRYTSNLLQHELSVNELQYVETLSKQYTYFLEDVEEISLFFSKNEDIQSILMQEDNVSPETNYDNTNKVDELNQTVTEIKDWDIDIYVIGKNGDRFFSNDYLPEKYDKTRENWGIFRKMNQENASLVWDTNYSFDRMYPSDVGLTAGRTINDVETGEILGYVLIDINENTLKQMYEDHIESDDEYFYIVDHFGNVISSDEGLEIGTHLKLPNIEEVLEGDNGYFKINKDGIPSILVYHSPSDYNLKFISIKPINTIANKISTIRYLTIAITLLVIIISSWFALLLSRTVTNPLYKLMDLMKKVAKGNLKVRFSSKFKDDIGVFGHHFNNMLNQLEKLIEDNYERKISMKNSEIKALRAQINPHFLYNTLDTVNWLARMKRTEEVSTIVLSLSSILKYSINTTESDFVKVETDLNQLKEYLTIQEFRYRDKFDVSIHVDEDVLEQEIPSLLLQPMVENAIVHGQENKEDKGKIEIELRKVDQRLIIVIKDDGIGMEPGRLKQILIDSENEDLGIGISNVKNRLRLYYDDTYEFTIESALNEGTTIMIKIPFEEGG